MLKLNARQLRDLNSADVIVSRNRRPIYFILDNIYDTYNIGGLFRLADAINAAKMYICGESETPPNHKIKKASIGTYKIVPWKYKKSVNEAIDDLSNRLPCLGELADPRNDKVQIVAVEQSKNAVPYTTYNYKYPIALVLGNETSGVSKEALESSDAVVEIPMYGINKSLNVIVSAAIVSYQILTKLKE